jgi:GT2 family glycosyltransferase
VTPRGTESESDAGRARSVPCSVVIPCHGGADLTRACVDSLLAQEPSPPAEILLVDNASADDTRTLDRLDPRIRVLALPRNLGFAGGVNAGLRAAREPFLLVLNNDTQAAPDLLALLLRELERDPDLGAVAPCSNHVKGAASVPVGDAGRTAQGRAAIRVELASRPALQHVTTLAGLCLLLRRSTLADVGLFDERFGHGNYEDDDFCLRLRLHGYRLGIAGRAFLHHEGHATFRRLGLDLAQELQRRRVQFAAKWRGDPAGRAHLAAWAGDVAGAAAAALEARHVWPRWADADWHLGRWRAACGDAAGAAARFAALRRACPAHADAALAEAAACLAAGDARGADAALAAAARAPLDVGQQRLASVQVGHRAWLDGHHEQALGAFRDALALAPDDAEVHNWIGVCELARGDLASAERHFRSASEHGHALAHTNLGICRSRRNDAAGALASFTRAVELLPHDAVARANLEAFATTASPR